MRWRRLYVTIAFALIGPAIGVGLFFILFGPAITNLGPFESGAFWELVSAIYIIGAPPMVLAGLLVATSAQRGARLSTLTLLSAIYGALFTAVSALLWTFLGSLAAGPAWNTIIAIAVAGAIAAFVTMLILGLFSLLRRRRGKVQA